MYCIPKILVLNRFVMKWGNPTYNNGAHNVLQFGFAQPSSEVSVPIVIIQFRVAQLTRLRMRDNPAVTNKVPKQVTNFLCIQHETGYAEAQANKKHNERIRRHTTFASCCKQNCLQCYAHESSLRI